MANNDIITVTMNRHEADILIKALRCFSDNLVEEMLDEGTSSASKFILLNKIMICSRIATKINNQ